MNDESIKKSQGGSPTAQRSRQRDAQYGISVGLFDGRFLEHSRVFYFANGDEEEVYIGSADWMARNLKHRIEVVAPVSDPSLKHYLKDVLLAAYLRDNVKARELQPDGTYRPVPLAAGEKRFDSQVFFVGHETALS